jgi:pyruvate formate lyase activating enzyme
VKLDTNGSRPEVLKSLLEKGLLDYVAMDIKASRENYAYAAGVRVLDETAGMCTTAAKTPVAVHAHVSLLEKIRASVELLKNGTVPYEFRTTVVKGIHTSEEFETIGQWLAGCRAYYLQAYRENENILAYCEGARAWGDASMQEDIAAASSLPLRLSNFTKEEMEEFVDIARKYIQKVELRGVE